MLYTLCNLCYIKYSACFFLWSHRFSKSCDFVIDISSCLKYGLLVLLISVNVISRPHSQLAGYILDSDRQYSYMPNGMSAMHSYVAFANGWTYGQSTVLSFSVRCKNVPSSIVDLVKKFLQPIHCLNYFSCLIFCCALCMYYALHVLSICMMSDKPLPVFYCDFTHVFVLSLLLVA